MPRERKPQNVTISIPRANLPEIVENLDKAAVVTLSDLTDALRLALLNLRAYAEDMLGRI